MSYVRAAGKFAPTALYDPLVALTMREGAWRPQLVAHAGTGDVVEVGCGTGTLAIALAEAGARVVGVDGDEDVLARAKAKAGGRTVDWRRGLAGELPLPDASADVVVMSLLLHHLVPDDKAAALAEARRVLRSHGRLLIADWGRPADPIQRVLFAGLQLADGVENTRDHAAGRLADILLAAGFQPTLLDRLRTAWGTLEVIEAAA